MAPASDDKEPNLFFRHEVQVRITAFEQITPDEYRIRFEIGQAYPGTEYSFDWEAIPGTQAIQEETRRGTVRMTSDEQGYASAELVIKLDNENDPEKPVHASTQRVWYLKIDFVRCGGKR